MSTDPNNKAEPRLVYEDESISDRVINTLYNDFFHFYILKFKNKHISRNMNYTHRKEKNPIEWATFKKLSDLCTTNGYDSFKYVRYVINMSKSHISVKDLLSIRFIRMYGEFRDLEIKYDKITSYLEKSYVNIREISEENGLTTLSDFLKFMLKNHQLMSYIKAGYISKYFLVLIPGIKAVRKYFSEEERVEFDTFIGNTFDVLYNNAINACNYTHKQNLLKVSEVLTK